MATRPEQSNHGTHQEPPCTGDSPGREHKVETRRLGLRLRNGHDFHIRRISKRTMKMKTLKTLAFAISLATLPLLLYAQQPSCALEFRECTFDPPGGNPISIPCAAQVDYVIDGPQDQPVYACRGTDVNCNGELPCNMWTRSNASIFYLYCPETDEQTFCIRKGTGPDPDELTSTTCTGEACDNGQPSKPNSLIPANNDANASQWKPWPRR